MLYSAPPGETDEDEKRADADAETEVKAVEAGEATANWTGEVPADD